MWLLNAHTREMREFISHKQAPHYAILSHTWGEEEISFKDWQDGAWEHMKQKEGFRKIDGCCRQAVAESLDWVWIDTCCIDKRSSAELSEAINSMFNWYKQADVCYAYLYDVFDNIESNLGRCHWVTRGWTLQELIAPRKVVFYSGDWKALGTRSELAGRLATVTGIDKQFLTGKALGDASVAQRMSWAAKRTTSREEDEAYCLLGMFDVNMPLIYGEGPKAFRRLQEVIAREYPEDHSLFAWGKIVERLSNQVDNDDERIGETKPIPYDHNGAGIKFLGLLAESPKDFRHSGQVVCALQATNFFRFAPKASLVLTLIGRTAQISLPVSHQTAHIFNHLKYPPIVQLLRISWIVLLCGHWNDSITNFRLATIPIVLNSDSTECCRVEEIVIGDSSTGEALWGDPLIRMVQRCNVAPVPRTYPQSGSIILRRSVSPMPSIVMPEPSVNFSFLRGLVILPDSIQGVLFDQDYEIRQGLGLTLTCVRLDALNHPHEDPTQARDCGTLSFFFNPFTFERHVDPELKIINNRRSFREVGTQEKSNLMTFPTMQDGRNFGYHKWHQIKYKHDMVQPWDEWRISAIGLADVYISVERFFLDEYESDGSSSGNASHHFVDVVDIVVKHNTEDNTVKDDGDRQQKNNDSTEEKNAAREVLNEGNVNDVKRKKKEKDDGQDGNWEDTDEWSTCDESTDDNASTGI